MKTIAVAGKGGTGKTTISAMLIHWIGVHITKSILAVDADANVNLNDVLGISLNDTIGAIREEMREKIQNIPAGMTKQQFLEYKIQTSLVETPDFDLIAMGRPEGSGCYCYSNNLLRDILKTLCTNYDFIIIDNEAGMEHLSSKVKSDFDYLLIVSDPIVRGIQTAGKISRLVNDLKTRVKEKYLILNRINNSVSQPVLDTIKIEDLNLLGIIPEDNDLLSQDQQGNLIWPIISKSAAYQALKQIMPKLEIKSKI